jgi:hypothetical protein
MVHIQRIDTASRVQATLGPYYFMHARLPRHSHCASVVVYHVRSQKTFKYHTGAEKEQKSSRDPASRGTLRQSNESQSFIQIPVHCWRSDL